MVGILGLLDKDETDWKVIAINAREATEKNVETMQDIDIFFPDLLD